MTTTGKPVWLLDVDGVLNSLSRSNPTCWPDHSWKSVTGFALGSSWPILFSTKVIDFINRMSDRVDIRWHTTWQTDAIALGELLGIEQEFPVSDSEFHTLTDWNTWWKASAGAKVVTEENRPLIWTDDDLDSFQRNLLLNDIGRNHFDDVCLVTPNPLTGLIRKELEQIESFVEEVEARDAETV